MINLEEFKDRLFEFIEFRREPFDIKYIYESCRQPIDIHHIYEALYELENEGKIICLSNGQYTSTRIAIKRWIKEKLVNVLIPDYLIQEIEWILKLKPKEHQTIDEFISTAIKEFIDRIKNWNAKI